MYSQPPHEAGLLPLMTHLVHLWQRNFAIGNDNMKLTDRKIIVLPSALPSIPMTLFPTVMNMSHCRKIKYTSGLTIIVTENYFGCAKSKSLANL